MKKRLLSLLLLVSMLASTVSCSGGTEETPASSGETPSAVTEETVAEDAETEAEETEPEVPLTDGLPEKNMDGYTFNILNYKAENLSWANTRIFAEEMNGEAVNDAMFERESTIEEGIAEMNERVAEILG